jgi:hypothetical protein
MLPALPDVLLPALPGVVLPPAPVVPAAPGPLLPALPGPVPPLPGLPTVSPCLHPDAATACAPSTARAVTSHGRKRSRFFKLVMRGPKLSRTAAAPVWPAARRPRVGVHRSFTI